MNEIRKEKSKRSFCFGPGKVYKSEEKYFVPILVKRDDDKEVNLEIGCQVIIASVPMLCGWIQLRI